ncbi:MAG: hypothetical protein Q9194_006638, partial [Teloschistes cf. exilis]
MIPDGIFSATYSNVPVYEFNIEQNHVMRRRQDDWINATHILKVADYDKPARTRILEREVQKGIHEKVQGGYGKYQGTWVPLHEGRLLAERNGVLGKLLPLFDYIPGPISPPQAPKHQTAASNKGPKQPRVSKINRQHMPPPSQISEDPYDGISAQLDDDDSIDRSEIGSETFVADDDMTYSQQTGSRKRKRAPEISVLEHQHTIYADALLDYFMLSESDHQYRHDPPEPPAGFMVNRPIDDQGHTALHWGAAMGDIETIRMFINRGARVDVPNVRGETPMIRAVLFTNNYEKETMPKLVEILLETIMQHDRYGATVLHHVAMTTTATSRKKSARYYLSVLLTRLADLLSPQDFTRFLESRDNRGDTAIHIAARHGARKLVRLFLARGVSVDIANNNNETAQEIMQRSHIFRADDITTSMGIASSSPVQQPAGILVNGHHNANSNKANPLSSSFPDPNGSSQHYETQSARSFSTSFGPTVSDKALQVTLAMEDELQAMDASLADAQKLIESTAKERQSVQQKIFEASLEAGQENREHVEGVRRALEEKEKVLRRENESFGEWEQHRLLHAEVRSQEELSARNNNNNNHNPNNNNSNPQQQQQKDHLSAALALATAQSLRRRLCKQQTDAQAMAGMGERGEMYKRLIASSMG